jgi:hypothetical protein
MKSKAAIALGALLLLLASCQAPTSTIPGVQTIWWQADEEGAVRFSTNDEQCLEHTFMSWGDSPVDPFQSLEVEVSKTSGNPWGGFGIVFCVQDANNYYLLGIDALGYHTVGKLVGGSWYSIVDWTFTPLLNQGYGASNWLQVSRDPGSSTFAVKLNGSTADSFVDTSLDGGYGGYYVEVGPRGFEHFPSFPVEVRFRDRVAIAVTPAGGLLTTEAAGTATFSIVLERQPAADVAIPLSSSDATEGSVSPASVTFTPASWDVPQTVTVSGVDDSLLDGDQAYSILTGPAVSGDPGFSGLDPLDVSVVNKDNELFEVLAPRAQADALFGSAAAVDGDYAVVGAKGESGGGAAYLFHRVGVNAWDSGVRVTAPDVQADDLFGSAVALSGDYAIVGAPGEDDGGANAGAAYIFHRTGTNTWDYGAKIVAPDAAAGDAFGLSVGISGDYAAAGASGKSEGAARAGAAYVFHRTAVNAWDSPTKVASPDGGYDEQFGHSVGLSGDYLIVGARYDGEGGSGAGAAYVFLRSDTNSWASVTKIVAGDAQANDRFGSCVAISGDYAIVGAPGENQLGTDAGAAYVFPRTDTNTWGPGAKILAGGGQAGDQFGTSVGISGDRAVVGAPGPGGGSGAGAGYLYVRTGTNSWDAGTQVLAWNGQTGDRFGASAGISGACAIFGAEYHDRDRIDAGAAYLYQVP